MIKYYKQIAQDMIKISEEKIQKIFDKEISSKKDFQDDLNTLNTIYNIYLLFGYKYIYKKSEISLTQIQENNLNDENPPIQINKSQTNLDGKNLKEISKNFLGKLFSLLILNKEDFIKINSHKNLENFNEVFNSIDKKNYLNSSRTLINLYINEIIFIHFNEFLITTIKKETKENLYLSLIYMNILIGYFYWKDEQKVNIFYLFLEKRD